MSEESFLPSLPHQLELEDDEKCELHRLVGLSREATGRIVAKKPMTLAEAHDGKRAEFKLEHPLCDACGALVLRLGFDRALQWLRDQEHDQVDDSAKFKTGNHPAEDVLQEIDKVLGENSA